MPARNWKREAELLVVGMRGPVYIAMSVPGYIKESKILSPSSNPRFLRPKINVGSTRRAEVGVKKWRGRAFLCSWRGRVLAG